MHKPATIRRAALVLAPLLTLGAAGASESRPMAAPTAGPVGAERLQPAGLCPLQAFDLRGVTLDGGHLRAQTDQVREYYLQIPNDDLLKGFRLRAGRPAPGNDLGGWYSADIFHVFGQIVSGLSRLYAATGDEACREKAVALIEGWAECIEPDGFFYYSTQPNAPHYIYDKMVGGLVDAYLYCGYEPALPVLSRITDWAVAHLKRDRPYADGSDDTEWYTLSENLYRAYLATGDAKYRDFAQVWEYTEYWDLYATGTDLFARRPSGGQTGAYHAYSHVNTLGGLGAAYLATGEKRYLDTLVKAYDTLQATQVFATGGYGPDEQLLPHEALLRKLTETHNSFETQCGSWAAFKMCRYLITGTGDARFGDWVERLVYNGIGADLPMSADGQVYYYADYNVRGASKGLMPTPWTCCTGTRPMAVAAYHDLIYFHSADSLCVNLFVPSTATFAVGGKTVTVRQRTRFPERPATEFTVTTKHPVTFALRVRVPGWVAAPPQAAVNGKPLAGLPVSDHWVTVRRKWRSGDRLTVQLPMSVRAESFDATRPYPMALLYGPVVLAVRAQDARQLRGLDPSRLAESLVPSPGEELTYHLAGDPSVLVRPFYAVKEGERYFLYLDPTAPQWVSHQEVTFEGDWPVNGPGLRASPVIGAALSYTFEGTGIRWVGYRFDDAGIGEVSIDGQVVDRVDQYDPTRGVPFRWEHTGLAPGRHTIRIVVSPDKDPASKDHYVNISGFEVLDEAAQSPSA